MKCVEIRNLINGMTKTQQQALFILAERTRYSHDQWMSNNENRAIWNRDEKWLSGEYRANANHSYCRMFSDDPELLSYMAVWLAEIRNPDVDLAEILQRAMEVNDERQTDRQ